MTAGHDRRDPNLQVVVIAETLSAVQQQACERAADTAKADQGKTQGYSLNRKLGLSMMPMVFPKGSRTDPRRIPPPTSRT